jgi:predicted nuclease of predicted toxin-antitoxin system
LNWLLDENVDRVIAERLRFLGEDVLYIAEVDPSVSDEVVLERARENEAVLLTADKDFGELVFRRRLVSAGVVLLRLSGLEAEEKAAIVEALLASHAGELAGHFTVVTASGVRIRRMMS